jgi:hypothetical protein
MSATPTPAAPDRAIHEAILAALALNTPDEKGEALTTALQSWQADGDAVHSPHILVHILKDTYKLAELPDALTGNDTSDFVRISTESLS